MKECKKCNTMKLESEFHRGRGRPCKACRIGEYVGRRKYQLEYYIKNKEKSKLAHKLYQKNNRESCNKRSNEYRKKQRDNLDDAYIVFVLRKNNTPITENSIANQRASLIKYRNRVIASKNRKMLIKTRECISCKGTKLSNLFLSNAGKYCDKCRESKEKEKKSKNHNHVVNVADYYVRQLIKSGSKILSNKDIPDAFVEAKKLQIQLIRKINEDSQPFRRNRHKLSDRIAP